MKWYKVEDKLPEFVEDNCGLLDSEEVLFIDKNKKIYIGYLRKILSYDDTGDDYCWKMAGRDGYTVDDVVAWMPVTELPPIPDFLKEL